MTQRGWNVPDRWKTRTLTRRFAAVFIVLAMLVPLSAGMAEDFYTLDYYWIGNGDCPAREQVEKAVNAYIEPLIGARVEFHIIGWNAWETQVLQALQGGEKMDIIFTADWRDYMTEVMQDLLLPLDALLDTYGMGIREGLDPAFLNETRVDGLNYGVPTNKELCQSGGLIVNLDAAMAVEWDVLGRNGEITSLAEIEPWLAKYKELYPEKYPYLIDDAAGRWPDEPWCPSSVGMQDNCLAYKLVPEMDGTMDDTLYNVYATDEQRAHIALMYRWAQAGYIAPEAGQEDYDAAAAFNAGDFLVRPALVKGSGIKTAELTLASGNLTLNCAEITLQPKYRTTAGSSDSMLAIPVTCGNPEKAMQFINLMHTDAKLINMMLYGVEGKQWKMTEFGQVELTDASWYGAHGGAWTVGNILLQMTTMTELPEKNALLQAYANDAQEVPSLGFRFLWGDMTAEVEALSRVVREYARPLMLGKIDPDDSERGIAALLQKMDEAGVETIMAEINGQYAVWKQNDGR